MGKRKSKAGKQKQAKAKFKTQKRKENAKFNIPLSQDGIIAEKTANKNNDFKAIPKKLQKKLRGSKPKKSPANQSRNQEQKEFDEEYRSLQERQFNAQLCKGKSKKKTLDLAPALLQINQKPTAEQLVADAATHLEGMNQLGQSSMLSGQAVGGNPNRNLLQVLAAQKRREDYLAQQEAEKPRDIGAGNNFWALQEASSDEEVISEDVTPSFNFTAPSFALPSTFGTNVSSNIPFDDDDL